MHGIDFNLDPEDLDISIENRKNLPILHTIKLHRYIMKDDLENIKKIVELYKNSDYNIINVSNPDHRDFLHNVVLRETKFPALHTAIIKGNVYIIQYLINEGADVDGASYGDFELYVTPLGRAVKSERLDIIDILIHHEAGVDYALYSCDETPFQIAIRGGKIEYMEKLFAHGADITLNHINNTPLIIAAESKQPEAARWLLKHGADVNQKDIFQKTAIDHAVSPEVIELLFNYGAEPYIKEEGGSYRTSLTLWWEILKKEMKELASSVNKTEDDIYKIKYSLSRTFKIVDLYLEDGHISSDYINRSNLPDLDYERIDSCYKCKVIAEELFNKITSNQNATFMIDDDLLSYLNVFNNRLIEIFNKLYLNIVSQRDPEKTKEYFVWVEKLEEQKIDAEIINKIKSLPDKLDCLN